MRYTGVPGIGLRRELPQGADGCVSQDERFEKNQSRRGRQHELETRSEADRSPLKACGKAAKSESDTWLLKLGALDGRSSHQRFLVLQCGDQKQYACLFCSCR